MMEHLEKKEKYELGVFLVILLSISILLNIRFNEWMVTDDIEYLRSVVIIFTIFIVYWLIKGLVKVFRLMFNK
jgi:hypothetical protein